MKPVSQLCRLCSAPLTQTVVDLGMSPLCESFVPPDKINSMEPFFPLHAKVCGACFLVQLDDYVSPAEIFGEYAYFSSYSDSWLKHAAAYTEMIVDRLNLGSNSFVVELASNDGYLLKNFVSKGIPCIGVEPAANIAKVAEQVGVKSIVKFFGVELAEQMVRDGMSADLILGNNVLAQVPDLNDFVEGIKLLLNPGGVMTIEFPHLMKLMERCEYDTIYHEHFCYFSWVSAERVFARHGLRLFDVEELPTHGGSLRIFACHEDNHELRNTKRAVELRSREIDAGFEDMEIYRAFGERVKKSKWALLRFLLKAKEEGKSIAGYGAPGKGNTLLNYCGIRQDFVEYTVDRNPYKHGRVLPGTHIPIFPVEKIKDTKPDYLLILPWNLKKEIMKQMAYIRDWGGRFVVPIPIAEVFE